MKRKLVIAGKSNLKIDHISLLNQKFDLKIYDTNVLNNDIHEVIERIKGASVVALNAFTPITNEVLLSCPNLTHLISCSSGINHVDIDACKINDVKLKWFPSYCARTVAEKTFAYILISMNQILPAMEDVKKGNWNYLAFPGRELFGKTICICGLGNTGKLIKKYSEAFGLNVLYTNSKTSLSDTKKYLANSDIVSLQMNLNQETINYLDKEKLECLKNDVVIINTSRGQLINEEELSEFLKSNVNAIAFLDVLEVEPPFDNSPLINLKNVYITPHIGWNSIESDKYLADNFCIEILKTLE